MDVLSSQTIKVMGQIIVGWEGKMLEGETNHYYENNRIKRIALFGMPKSPVNDEGLS